MGLGVALGAATRSFQDTSRQLGEQDWLAEQRRRQQDQWQREDAIRNTYAQTAKPGQEVMSVTVNGADYEMTPEQAAIYREAGQNGSDVGAISRRRVQTEQDYLRNMSDNLAGLDPQAAMQLRAQAKQFEQSDMQLAAMRDTMRKQEVQNKFLWLAQNKDALDDTTFLSGMAELVSAGGKDQRRAEVRMSEDGKPEVWMTTPDGKQARMQLPEDRNQLLAAAGKYLDMASYQNARKEEREDARNKVTDTREDRKLSVLETNAQSEADYRKGKLRIDEMEALQKGAYYRAMTGAAGAKGAKWNLVGYDDKNNTLIYQGTTPDGRLVIDTQLAVDKDGKPLNPTAIKGLFRGGVEQPGRAIDRAKAAEKFMENNPDATQRQLIDYLAKLEGGVAGVDPYGLTSNGAFFSPDSARRPSAVQRPPSPTEATAIQYLDSTNNRRAIDMWTRLNASGGAAPAANMRPEDMTTDQLIQALRR